MAPSPIRAHRPDRSAVQENELFGEREADAGAAEFSGAGHVDLKKSFEDGFGHVGGKPDAGVGDIDPHVVPLVFDGDRHLPRGRCELRRIGEEVDEDAFDALEIAPHHALFDVGRKGYLDRFSLGQRFDLHRERAQVRDDVVFVDPEAQPRLFELRQVQEVGNEPQELHPAALNRREGRSLRRGEAAELAIDHELERREHHGERGLQLVRDVGEEL